MSETITIKQDSQSQVTIGERTHELGRTLAREDGDIDQEAFDSVCKSSATILSHCIGSAPGTTGLVVGYVQSGKTMSMVTLAALAHDNGYPIVIFLTGVTNILQDQTFQRLSALREASRNHFHIWNALDTLPDPTRVASVLAKWKTGRHKETYIYAVTKNHERLAQLTEHLRASQVDARVKVLIVDDEADQASLNTRPESTINPAVSASTTHRKITELRATVPGHAYVQYTATPQAPLLISIDDILSPRFVCLLEPGAGYVGGETLFSREHRDKIRQIPEDDLPTSERVEPPESLLDALRVFWVAAALSDAHGLVNVRSMLVHPGKNRTDHNRYREWVDSVVKRWRQAMLTDWSDVWEELADARAELHSSLGLQTSDDLLRDKLDRVIDGLEIKTVNSEDASEIDWKREDNFILVGGEKLNRGFTVKGLIVTYMPRGPGGNNADTVQQRARFFGYKAKVLPLIRLWLESNVHDSFSAYVEHERDLREQLRVCEGKPLREWVRAFYLAERIKPTRRNVLLEPGRVHGNSGWIVLDPVPLNSDALERYQSRLEWDHDAFKPHRSCSVKLRSVFDDLLVDYHVVADESQKWAALKLLLNRLANDDSECLVLGMQRTKDSERQAGGSLRIMQGESGGKGPGGYKGDRAYCAPHCVTIQVHRFKVNGEPQATICVHIPDYVSKSVYVQDA